MGPAYGPFICTVSVPVFVKFTLTGFAPNLSVKQSVTIDTIINFDGDGYGHGNSMCKRVLTLISVTTTNWLQRTDFFATKLLTVMFKKLLLWALAYMEQFLLHLFIYYNWVLVYVFINGFFHAKKQFHNGLLALLGTNHNVSNYKSFSRIYFHANIWWYGITFDRYRKNLSLFPRLHKYMQVIKLKKTFDRIKWPSKIKFQDVIKVHQSENLHFWPQIPGQWI